jgi:hypothetical protein
MYQPSRQAVVISCVLLLGGAWAWLLAAQARDRVIDAGFWFERVTYESSRLGSPPTSQEMETIASIAFSEITHAFAGLRITFSDRRNATYQIRVVQELRDMRFRRYVGVAGEARAISGLGGQGAVSFSLLASHAVGYAPPDADRTTLIAAIGRGIGRAAVHEFTHLLLPRAPIHDSTDIQSYEYASPDRREQYYGEMHWDIAWSLLRRRVGVADASALPAPQTKRRKTRAEAADAPR